MYIILDKLLIQNNKIRILFENKEYGTWQHIMI